jgi:hypothetical protein
VSEMEARKREKLLAVMACALVILIIIAMVR